MTDFQTQADALLAAEDAGGLARLLESAANKKEKKAAKRAIYLLEQRGIAVPKLAPSTAPGTSLGPVALPVMMGVPTTNDGRLFTFAHAEGGKMWAVEARFSMPEGLDVLQGSPTTRADYLPWAKRMCTTASGALPERSRLVDGMLGRKRWEIRRCVGRGWIGSEVDLALAKRISGTHVEPHHPADTLHAEARVPIGRLDARGYLESLVHEEPMDSIRTQLGERGGTVIVVQGDDSPLARMVREWAEEWELDRLRETLGDLACYAAGLGDHDSAATLAHARLEPVAFLTRLVAHRLGVTSPV